MGSRKTAMLETRKRRLTVVRRPPRAPCVSLYNTRRRYDVLKLRGRVCVYVYARLKYRLLHDVSIMSNQLSYVMTHARQEQFESNRINP